MDSIGFWKWLKCKIEEHKRLSTTLKLIIVSITGIIVASVLSMIFGVPWMISSILFYGIGGFFIAAGLTSCLSKRVSISLAIERFGKYLASIGGVITAYNLMMILLDFLVGKGYLFLDAVKFYITISTILAVCVFTILFILYIKYTITVGKKLEKLLKDRFYVVGDDL